MKQKCWYPFLQNWYCVNKAKEMMVKKPQDEEHFLSDMYNRKL